LTLSAVVMAAGEGTRLRPLTETWPKPLLPIDGRPVLATLLRELAATGFERVMVVTGHLAEQTEALVGNGSRFGLVVETVRQPEAVGSADAVIRALRAGAEPPVLVTAADTVFTPGDLAAAVETWEGSSAAGALGVRRGGRPGQPPVRVEDGRIVDLDVDAAEHTAAPVWVFGEEIAAALPDLPGPPFEVARAVQDALAARKEILALHMGPTRDITRPADVMRHNFPYLSRYER
jgi:NDP-sugar pyrophosphorylase family protein